MLVGLEFLVAGDIIRTVVVIDTITDVASLGLVVVIRTVLVFTIHLEVEGHWPWQASKRGDWWVIVQRSTGYFGRSSVIFLAILIADARFPLRINRSK